MLKILYELCSERKAASIYTDDNYMNKFHFGFVLAVNEKEFAIQMITPDGEDDGIKVMRVDYVFRVNVNGQYEEKMKKLCQNNIRNSYDLLIDNNDIKKSVIQYAFRQNQLVSIELIDSGYNDVVGFIESIDNNGCSIEQVDEFGYSDGISYINLEDITQVNLATQDEKRITKLWKLNQ